MRQKGFTPIIVLLVVILLGALGYFVYTKVYSSEQKPILTSSATPIELPVATNTFTGKCHQQDGGLFKLSQSEQGGWCELSLPLINYDVSGYTLIYPDNWNVRIVGAEVMNLLFNEGVKTGRDQELFIQITSSTLPIEQVDKATSSFEMSGPEPLVDPKEILVNKKVENIGGKEVLNLSTKLDGNLIQRYFVLHKGTQSTGLYMFKTSGENKELLGVLLQMVSSMQFLK